MILINALQPMHTMIRFLLTITLIAGLSSTTYAATIMAAVGDSITSGWPEVLCARGKQKHGGYSKYLEPKLDSNGWATTLYNYGIHGDRAEWAYKTYDRRCSDENWSHNGQAIRHNQIPVALARSPELSYILYLFGTNDLGYGHASTVFARIKIGVNAILAGGVTPVVGTIMPDTRSGKEFKETTELNSLLRAWLNGNEIQIAEFYNATSNSGWKNMMSDGIHPDDDGRQFMANIWFDALNEDKEKKAAAQRARIAASMAGINLLLLDD